MGRGEVRRNTCGKEKPKRGGQNEEHEQNGLSGARRGETLGGQIRSVCRHPNREIESSAGEFLESVSESISDTDL